MRPTFRWWRKADQVGTAGARPRSLGVAWSITPRMVLRAGYGIFYQQTERYGSESLEQIVTNGRADYDALQTRAQRRFANGFAFTAA